jgi:hypothetical protein
MDFTSGFRCQVSGTWFKGSAAGGSGVRKKDQWCQVSALTILTPATWRLSSTRLPST